MSNLRKKLQQARHEYQHQRYPGDLADDVLGRADVVARLTPAKKPSHWVRHISLAAALAIAATAGIVLLSQESGSQPGGQIAIVTPGDPTTSIAPPVDGSRTPDGTTSPTDSAANVAGSAEGEEEIEERWSVVPTEIALSQETSFSLVPSMSYEAESGLEDDGVQQ